MARCTSRALVTGPPVSAALVAIAAALLIASLTQPFFQISLRAQPGIISSPKSTDAGSSTDRAVSSVTLTRLWGVEMQNYVDNASSWQPWFSSGYLRTSDSNEDELPPKVDELPRTCAVLVSIAAALICGIVAAFVAFVAAVRLSRTRAWKAAPVWPVLLSGCSLASLILTAAGSLVLLAEPRAWVQDEEAKSGGTCVSPYCGSFAGTDDTTGLSWGPGTGFAFAVAAVAVLVPAAVISVSICRQTRRATEAFVRVAL